MSLAVVFADLFAPTGPLDAAARASLPLLPAFERLLCHARLAPTDGWRQWLAGTARDAGQGGVDRHALVGGFATTVARARVPGVQAGFWLATPVHYVAGLDSVRLHPHGLIELDTVEQQELASNFASVFSSDDLHLHPTGGRELLLQVPIGWEVPPSADPARFLGREPGAGLPGVGRGSPLRRLGAELEMWLHGLRLNERRAAAGRLSVTGLWLWGGGTSTATPVPQEADGVSVPMLADLSGGDVFARALWGNAGGRLRPQPADFAAWRATRDPQRDAVIVVPTLGEQWQPDLQRLDTDWCAPLTAALRSGELQAVSLIAGGCVATSTPRSHWRFWRRTRPWWQHLT